MERGSSEHHRDPPLNTMRCKSKEPCSTPAYPDVYESQASCHGWKDHRRCRAGSQHLAYIVLVCFVPDCRGWSRFARSTLRRNTVADYCEEKGYHTETFSSSNVTQKTLRVAGCPLLTPVLSHTDLGISANAFTVRVQGSQELAQSTFYSEKAQTKSGFSFRTPGFQRFSRALCGSLRGLLTASESSVLTRTLMFVLFAPLGRTE